MAKVHNNIFVRGLTGAVGEPVVICKTKSGRTIIANKPMFDENRECSEIFSSRTVRPPFSPLNSGVRKHSNHQAPTLPETEHLVEKIRWGHIKEFLAAQVWPCSTGLHSPAPLYCGWLDTKAGYYLLDSGLGGKYITSSA